MDRNEILAKLKMTEPRLRALGVRRAALFGSRARGDQSAGSDIDILLEFEPEARITVFDYMGIKEFVADLFEGDVDVVDREGLKAHVAAGVEAAALYAF